ncbi:alpha/beta hydrolase [Algibacter sp. R77976]|uniref:alpha/beta hydrolase n=1 Tax=Algibacter sp. R77976 TaxID=3093873 RepID=UPI0037CC3591
MFTKSWTIIALLLMFVVSCKNEEKKATSKVIQTKDVTYFKNYPHAKLFGGKLMRLDKFPSKYITPRPVDIWLPGNYSDTKHYAVVYMHDGQMLFDSTTTWNKQEWKVDEWATKLMHEKTTSDFIVVAIHNIAEERWLDLFPQKTFKYLSEQDKEAINNQSNQIKQGTRLNGDNYLKFLVDELKPIVDSEFSVFKSKENTFVMGSSMGGLMSLYAICEYPNIFGGAACLSTHWPGANPIDNNPLPSAIFKYMENNLPNPKTHKLYFDFGTKTLDAHYPQYAPTVSQIFTSKGYKEHNFRNLKFEGTNHSENAWNQRLNKPLTFLLGQ